MFLTTLRESGYPRKYRYPLPFFLHLLAKITGLLEIKHVTLHSSACSGEAVPLNIEKTYTDIINSEKERTQR